MKLGHFIVLVVGLTLVLSCTAPPKTPTPMPTPPSPTPTPPALRPPPQPEEYYIKGEKYILPTFGELERERAGLVRSYPKVMKGVWEPSPTFGHRLINKSLPEVKDLGVNTVLVMPWYDYRDDKLTLRGGDLSEEKAEREIIDRVVKAKKAGFAVWLLHSYFGAQAKTISNLEAFDEFALEQAKKWAQIAEAYKVEYFSPINEYERLIEAQGFSSTAAVERTGNWSRRALTGVRPIFKGKIVLKVKGTFFDVSPIPSASGYDILGVAFTVGGPREAYQRRVQETFGKMQTVAKRDNVEWMVGEFFLLVEGRSDEQRVAIFRVVFDEYKKALKAEKKPVGFAFNSWEKPEEKVKDTGIVPLLKQFFREMDSTN